jgi:tRNA(Phe) wybutosine-synthesizing methylase Tyw3
VLYSARTSRIALDSGAVQQKIETRLRFLHHNMLHHIPVTDQKKTHQSALGTRATILHVAAARTFQTARFLREHQQHNNL